MNDVALAVSSDPASLREVPHGKDHLQFECAGDRGLITVALVTSALLCLGGCRGPATHALQPVIEEPPQPTAPAAPAEVVRVSGTLARIPRVGRWGGAMPTPKQKEAWRRANEAATPQPIPRFKVLVRSGATNTDVQPIAEITTDKNGRFDLVLTPGTYCAVTEGKRQLLITEPPLHYDAGCLERERTICDAVWQVHANTTNDVSVLLHDSAGRPRCYRGTGPP
jgi:hypothetical protein